MGVPALLGIFEDNTHEDCSRQFVASGRCIGAIAVAIYTRVSTVGQVGGRFDSCASQEAVCRDYITSRPTEGWFEVACYTDAAYSGADMDWPAETPLEVDY